VPAGCSPVRAEIAPDGDSLYVTARGSNALLLFDTERLMTDPEHALIDRVPVGTAPVGLAVVDTGRSVIVTNSSRFGGSGGQDLTVINTSRILKGENPVAGTLPAGEFPRELHTTTDGKTLLLTNFGSDQLELINLDDLQSLLKRGSGPVAGEAQPTGTASAKSAGTQRN
jgi:DNA-binding beta-propeller fold protein YncE